MRELVAGTFTLALFPLFSRSGCLAARRREIGESARDRCSAFDDLMGVTTMGLSATAPGLFQHSAIWLYTIDAVFVDENAHYIVIDATVQEHLHLGNPKAGLHLCPLRSGELERKLKQNPGQKPPVTSDGGISTCLAVSHLRRLILRPQGGGTLGVLKVVRFPLTHQNRSTVCSMN